MKKNKCAAALVIITLLALLVGAAILLSQCDGESAAQPETSSATFISSSPGTSAPQNSKKPTTSTLGSTAASSTPASSAPVGSRPTQSTTAPTQQSTQAATKPTQPATQSTTSPAAPSCAHVFTEWAYEEYTYRQQHPIDGLWYDRSSHRQYRTCTKCGHKETGNTPDHSCQRGSTNHTVTTIQEGNCLVMTIKRSTCTICGWYVDYETKKGSHEWIDRDVHLADYGPYTNELDATISECTACNYKSVVYHKGKGWQDDNKYYASFSVSTGTAYAMMPVTGNFNLVDHPTWQSVWRDFTYDENGYVKQFTLYWWYEGKQYSQIINCGKGEIESWFAVAGLVAPNPNAAYIFQIYGTFVAPYAIGYS